MASAAKGQSQASDPGGATSLHPSPSGPPCPHPTPPALLPPSVGLSLRTGTKGAHPSLSILIRSWSQLKEPKLYHHNNLTQHNRIPQKTATTPTIYSSYKLGTGEPVLASGAQSSIT